MQWDEKTRLAEKNRRAKDIWDSERKGNPAKVMQHKSGRRNEKTAKERYTGGGGEQRDAENSADSTQVGVFHNEGKLNMMHVDAVNEHFEKGALSSRRLEDMVEKLLRETDWRREMEQLSSRSGNELQEMMNRERREYRPVVYREIMKNRETAREKGIPGEVVVIGATQQSTGRIRQEETNGEEQPAREKRTGLHDTFLHELRKEKGKQAEMEMAHTSQEERGEDRKGRASTQTDLRMHMSPLADMKRKPRKEGGPNEPIPNEEPRETADPWTVESEKSGVKTGEGSSTKHSNEKLQMQMPVTEKWDATTALTEPKRCRMNALTWNIQGNEEALYDLEPALEKWDIDLAILTEVKTQGWQEKKEDKAWADMLDREQIVDVGGKRNTTLRRYDNRNIDRWITLSEDEGKHSTLNEGELTKHHASDHKMIATTRLDLFKCDTHLPRWEDEETRVSQRLDLPLTETQITALRRHLESGYFAERMGLERTIEQLKSAKTQEKWGAIDRAREEMANALKRMAREAMRNGESQQELILKGKGKPETKEEAMGKGLRLPKMVRKSRDAHLQKAEGYREQIKEMRDDPDWNPRKAHKASEGQEGTHLNTREEWERWLSGMRRRELDEAKKELREHNKLKREKTKDRVVRAYWKQPKQYHKLLYKTEMQNGNASTNTIKALQTREGQLETDPNKIAEAMGEHLSYSAPYKVRHPEQLSKQPPWRDTQHKERLIPERRPKLPKGSLTLDMGMYTTVKNNKATGLMGVQNEIIKHLPDEFHELLHTLMVQMWTQRHVPLSWKKGYFCFHHKKGDVTNQKNYRPIALLDGLFKFYTAMLAKMLADFCEINGILAEAQEGSRTKRNTLRQLTRITNAIEDANVSKQELHALYVDFENAYGSVDHANLLHTMAHLGVPEQLVEAVGDILGTTDGTAMQMRAKVGVHESAEVPIRRGLLQGDSMSPLLFIIYLEPLLRWLEVGEHGYKHKYATDEDQKGPLRTATGAFVDDLILLTPTSAHLVDQIDKLKRFEEWSGLKINPGKSAVTRILQGQNRVPKKEHEKIRKEHRERTAPNWQYCSQTTRINT
ncbi:hypothetical protein CYMTET_18497 [Cymbomonas tetramitiformis]|uniref:Reverse transcriptase domain-containing protein n=1 Tax=Cymbomonas tetramitiformis TaxID=36881 RepID=A0AAE0G802_9CHLO|nr:hypothetical protein CYMTET_18497 [Cymbomonas tetramitiformis]